MFQNRIIPCILRHDRGLVKTVKFKNPVYLGDPFNVTRLFNEKEVDELMILDIDASVTDSEPDYQFIEDIASECFMPVCYGGGIKNIEQIRKIFALGIEKVALSSVLIQDTQILSEAASIFGKQSIVAVLDVKKSLLGKYYVYTHNGKVNTKKEIVEFAKELETKGAGEIVINSIDKDGLMNGYDQNLLCKVTAAVSIPVIALGGAGSITDMGAAINHCNVSAAAAGSLFVFSGVHKAVLINYPTRNEIEMVLQNG